MENATPADETVALPVVVGLGAIGECVLWTKYCDAKGYGQCWVNGRMVKAHRQAWTDIHGDPGALLVCHRCDNPGCINVDHLFLGTNADNMADMVAKNRQSTAHGERNGNAKLTEDQVREIRASTESGLVIARRLGIVHSTVYQIRRRHRWAHIA